MEAIADIAQRLNELIDELGEVLDHSLPEDHRIGTESGEDAYHREIITPLLVIEGVLVSLE
tara:strand:- start:77 stop:259 length:183 start_codon:yes stop_codon:yes gene_type:complete